MKKTLLILLVSLTFINAQVFPAQNYTFNVTVAIDNSPPVVAITSPANEAAFSEGPITITGTATDTLSAIDNVSINVEGTVYTPTVGADGSFTVSNVTLTGGPNKITAQAQDLAGNTATTSITVFLGWVLHLDIPYQQVTDFGSGAASSQMILNYVRNGVADLLSQETIYNYGNQYNDLLNASLPEMDPKAIQYSLGHFDPYDLTDPAGSGDPYKAYNFSVESFASDKFTDYLRDIIHWMAYPVTVDYWWKDGDLVKWPNVPPAVPAYGTYNHWIIVNGAAATENPIPEPHTNPWYTPNFTAYGLWLTDPAIDGIGKDIYVTAGSTKDTYFLPIVSSDAYNGKYLQVAEPPLVESDAAIDVASPKVNEETLKLAASLKNNADTKPSASWRKIIDSSLMTDKGFVNAFSGAQAKRFIKVRRTDKENEFYYLIPFNKYADNQFLTYAAIIVNTEDGSFKEASWVDSPTRFIQVAKKEAIRLVLSANPALDSAKITAELVWQPGGPSQSPFYPYWKVTSGNMAYLVTQKGEVV